MRYISTNNLILWDELQEARRVARRRILAMVTTVGLVIVWIASYHI